jgi:outer membrane receptor for ferric coprogen and ferric-rhodotorulic acid
VSRALDSDDKSLLNEAPRDTLKLLTTYRLQSVPQLKVGGDVRWQGEDYY